MLFEEQEGEYRIVACLLAIMTGFPAVSSRLFGALLSESDEVPWRDFSRRVRREVPAGPDAAQWARLGLALGTLDGKLDDSQTLEAFRRWVPRVARYSFETSRLEIKPLAALQG